MWQIEPILLLVMWPQASTPAVYRATAWLKQTPDHHFQADQGSAVWTASKFKNSLNNSPIEPNSGLGEDIYCI